MTVDDEPVGERHELVVDSSSGWEESQLVRRKGIRILVDEVEYADAHRDHDRSLPLDLGSEFDKFRI